MRDGGYSLGGIAAWERARADGERGVQACFAFAFVFWSGLRCPLLLRGLRCAVLYLRYCERPLAAGSSFRRACSIYLLFTRLVDSVSRRVARLGLRIPCLCGCFLRRWFGAASSSGPDMWDVLLDLWAGCALLCLFVRAVAVCVVGFVSANAWVFVGAAIQVQAGSGSGSGAVSKGAARPAGSRRRRMRSADARVDRGVASAERRRDDTSIRPRPTSLPPSPPSPGRRQRDAAFPSIAPVRLPSPSSKEQQRISPASLLALYEDIMASDAETIQTLQATVRAQQEVILAQRGMMRDLQRLIDAQDAWIEAQMEERG